MLLLIPSLSDPPPKDGVQSPEGLNNRAGATNDGGHHFSSG